jgi:prephenate dehydrogenase
MAEQARIAIVGTGCIGTSIGLALHQTGQPLFIVGHDKQAAHADAARRMKAVDKTDWNLINACQNADLVILAIPMNAIEETLKALAPHLKEGSVVTDTASLKGQVMEWAGAWLPATVHFVGGDPVVTSTGSGPDAASADLFRDNLYCIIPAPSAHPDAVSLVSSLVSLLGGRPYYLDAAEHDGLMAGVAHLPYALATALINGATRQAAWREMRKLAGGGFDQIGAMVGEDPDALCDLLLANRDNLVRCLDAYMVELKAVRDLIAGGEGEPLAQSIDRALVARNQWIQDRRNRFNEISPGAEVERPNFLRQLLIGGGMRRR